MAKREKLKEIKHLSPPHLGMRHLRYGWWTLFGFMAMGFSLECMLGLKLDLYLNVDNETRRLMWRLCHSHGALLSLTNIAFGTLPFVLPRLLKNYRYASPCLIAGSILLPGGFFLGGIDIQKGDPGIGVFLSPLGAFFLLIAVFLTARDLMNPQKPS